MFDYAKIKSAAVAIVGALVFTTVSVGAAVGPAHQVQAAPIAAAEA